MEEQQRFYDEKISKYLIILLRRPLFIIESQFYII